MQTNVLTDPISLGSVTAFASLATSYVIYLFARLKTDHQFRVQKAEQIRAAGSTYSTRLAKLLDGMQSFWGAPFSAHALGICIVFQLLLSSFFFLIFWALGGSGKIGNTSLLPEWEDRSYRWIFVVGFSLYSLLIAFTIRFCGDIDVSVRNLIIRLTAAFGINFKPKKNLLICAKNDDKRSTEK